MCGSALCVCVWRRAPTIGGRKSGRRGGGGGEAKERKVRRKRARVVRVTEAGGPIISTPPPPACPQCKRESAALCGRFCGHRGQRERQRGRPPFFVSLQRQGARGQTNTVKADGWEGVAAARRKLADDDRSRSKHPAKAVKCWGKAKRERGANRQVRVNEGRALGDVLFVGGWGRHFARGGGRQQKGEDESERAQTTGSAWVRGGDGEPRMGLNRMSVCTYEGGKPRSQKAAGNVSKLGKSNGARLIKRYYAEKRKKN